MDSQLQISTTTCADLARNIAASCQRDRSRSSFYVRKRSKDLYLHTTERLVLTYIISEFYWLVLA